MNPTVLRLLMVILACWQPGLARSIPPPQQITVYVFLHESCVISQYYTPALRALHQEYSSEEIQFVGLFPNPASKPDLIAAFQEKYEIPFLLKPDYFHFKKDLLGATVTPEVVVYHEEEQKILYRGRIDDAYARVGQRKRFVSTSELKDVLAAIQNQEPILVAETVSVGCFIGDYKLGTQNNK